MEMESDPSVLFVDARVLDHTVKDNSKHRQLMPIRLVQADCVSISDDGHYCALYCHVYRRIDFWDILGPLFYLNRILLAVEYDIFQRILRCQQLSWSSCGGFIHALFVLSNGEQVISSVFDVFKRAMVSAWAICVPTINSVLFVPGASNMLLCSSIEYDHRNRHFLFDATEGFLLESDSWGMHTDDDSPMWRPTTDIQSYNILNPVAPNNISNPSKIPIIEDHGPVTGSADTVRPFGNSTAVSGTQFKFNFPSSLKCLQPSLASSGDVQVILGPANVSGDIFVVTKSVGTSSTPIENIIYNWNSYISSTESRTNGLLYFRLANVICLQDFEVHSLKFHSMNQQQFNHSIILIIGFRSGSVVARLMDKNSFRTISEISLVGINCLSIVGKTVSRAADINIDACITAISLGGNESISDSHPMGSDMPPVESSNDAVPNMVEVYFRLYGMRDQILLWRVIQNSPTPLVDGTNPLRDEDSCLQYLMLSRVDNQYMSKLSSPLNHISLSSGGAVLRHVDRWCYRYQYILFIDDDGFLKYISHGTASNFPGPQYPPGYNLIQQVIPYIETEDEFDCVTSVSADESPKRIELGDLVISIGNFQNESKSATWLDVPSHNHQFANLLKSSYEVENIGNVPTVVIDSIPANNDNDDIKKHSRLFLSDILPVPRKITNGDFIVSQTKDLEMGFDVKLTVSRVADVLTKFENEATDSVRRVELRRDKKRRLKKK